MPPDPEFVPPYAEMARLDGKTILVAGAGAGIGRQTVHAVAALGAKALCVDLTADLAEGVAAEVSGLPLVGDVSREEDVERLLAEAGEAGGPDGIIDIVGGAAFRTIAESELEDWRTIQGRNVDHAFLLMRHGAPALAARGGGTFVYIASASGVSSAPFHPQYGMAKAALLSLVRTAAVEFGPAGIRVNAVSPGIVWTPRMAAAIADDAPKWAALSPLGRVALPSDVAAAAAFLSTGLAGYLTGQNLLLDGGVDVSFPYPLEDLYKKSQGAPVGAEENHH